MAKWFKVTIITVTVLVVLAAIFAYVFVYPIFLKPNGPGGQDPVFVEIGSNDTFDHVVTNLVEDNLVLNAKHFSRCAKLLKYDTNVKAGRYKVQTHWNNLELVRHLRSGQQEPVKVTINNLRLLPELAGKVSAYLEFDSLQLLDALTRPQEYDPDFPYSHDSIMCLFLPNSYEFYWNTTPAKFLERMGTEYKRFWSEDRLAKANKLGLTPAQVYILASIVEKETLVKDEKATIAGVYLNRINSGILLQADPTVVFALQAWQKERVLLRDLTVDSPYNTYMYAGLPPGPICMPELNSIEAVLNPESHDYLYFCAKPDLSGRHAFAKTLAAHNANARKFQSWLNQQNIYK
jgi:UPF0755 protein